MLRSTPPILIGIQASSLNSSWGWNSSFLPSLGKIRRKAMKVPKYRPSPSRTFALVLS